MKTILDSRIFRKKLKKYCIEEKIEAFYLKSLIARMCSKVAGKPRVRLYGDLGDEVYDATYHALLEADFRHSETNERIYPYDVIDMKAKYDKDGKYDSMVVEYKSVCYNCMKNN